jgi:hypothetical protein
MANAEFSCAAESPTRSEPRRGWPSRIKNHAQGVNCNEMLCSVLPGRPYLEQAVRFRSLGLRGDPLNEHLPELK